MLARPTSIRLLVLAAFLGAFAFAKPAAAVETHGARLTAKELKEGKAEHWCAPEVEALGEDTCFIDGGGKSASRRTLVIFLHGVIAKNTTWSWTQERALLRMAKAIGFDAIFPRGPATANMYAWPGTAAAQEVSEQGLIDGWLATKRAVEKRDGRPFDEVYVMGFSSGAYFVSSLAMRGRMDVDGYAVFAGGQPMGARAEPVEHFAPVFVGVCAEDSTTATHSRAFAGSLVAAGIPRAVDEQRVGHGFSDIHLAHAIGYLRRSAKPRVASR